MNNKKINEIAAKLVDNVFFIKAVAFYIKSVRGRLYYARPVPDPRAIKKILIIKLEGMGDAVYLAEIAGRLKAAYPDIKIDILTTGKVPVFKILCPPDGFGIISINPLNISDYYKTIKSLNDTGYDFIADATGMPVNVPLMLAFIKTSKSYIAGFGTLKIKKALYDAIEDLIGDIHIFENYLKLFKIFDISRVKKITIELPEAFKAQEAGDVSAPAPPNAAKKIVLVLSSNAGGLMHRKLPLANSVKLIKMLNEKFGDTGISLLGGPDDYGYLEEIKKAAENASVKPAPVLKIEKTKNIEEAMFALKNSFLNICIDSGLMHLSSLVNPNTYCLFGYSDPKNSLPFNNIGFYSTSADTACSPCSFYRISPCADLKCMEAINIDAVMEDISVSAKNF